MGGDLPRSPLSLIKIVMFIVVKRTRVGLERDAEDDMSSSEEEGGHNVENWRCVRWL